EAEARRGRPQQGALWRALHRRQAHRSSFAGRLWTGRIEGSRTGAGEHRAGWIVQTRLCRQPDARVVGSRRDGTRRGQGTGAARHCRKTRSEEHTSELQSPYDLVCRLLLEKKKKNKNRYETINNIIRMGYINFEMICTNMV